MTKKILLIALILPFVALAQKSITLEDIYKKGTFRAEFVAGFNSMKDGRYYVEFEENNLVKKSFETGYTVETLVKKGDAKNEKGEDLSLADIEWSSNESKLLIYVDREFIYRRSSKAVVYVYDLATKKTQKVSNEKVLHATLNPDATKVAYVLNNNMYIYDIATKKTTQITKDGKTNAIINGNCDWVYEEEFSFTQAYQWSEKGTYLAYYKFDESKVPSFTFTMFDSLYPTQYTYKYPKAGDANSVVSIFIYDVKTGKQIKANTGKETDVYIPRIKFTKQDDKLSISWLNRLQNEMQLLLVDAKTGASKVYYQEKNKYYIETETADVEFLQDGKHAIISSEQQGYNQLYKIALDGSSKLLLTPNKTDVTSIAGIDEKNNKLYFIDCGRGSTNRDFCSVELNGNNYKLEMPQVGTHNIKMSSDFSYGFHTYSSITQPTVYSLVNMQTGKKRILKDNAKLSNLLLEYQTVTPQITKIANSKGDSLNAWMLYPKNFDATKKYPVLFCNYGGPGSQQVGNRWGAVNMWHQFLAQNGYMIVCVDNTGTGFRGEEFKKKTYLQLGKYEIEDQIDAAKYLATLPYVDGNRIGHWGWSYGGFMSSLAITKGADVFKSAIAVAPVTHWKFYDNIYTERYMRTPKTNAAGYNNNAPLSEVNKIKGNYLIIHGTADDNVHFQNSVAMIDEMVKKNIKFESAYYPNKNHGIYGGNTTFHIYSLMTKFILEKL